MMVRRLIASAGVGAVLAFGVLISPAQAAPGPAATPNAGALSCPGGAPAAEPGYRCLSSYLQLSECRAGVARNIEVTPATSGYCQSHAGKWWGFVNIY
ncbi:hypothetical protein ABZ714_04845 [Streptomyces sp. NPDC006798]|uniref:hypothetical protein n=1 Tax=Streptomyces sp. NPDC006798 TaxID=3155462 RepID=UPI0033E05B20